MTEQEPFTRANEGECRWLVAIVLMVVIGLGVFFYIGDLKRPPETLHQPTTAEEPANPMPQGEAAPAN